MPSSPNYKRNYKEEWSDAKKRGEGKDNADRHKLRYSLEKDGIVSKNDGKDVAHKKALSKGGANSKANVTVQSKSENRSFARNSDGSLKSETSKREKK